MPEYVQHNNFPLKIIFLLHFLLTSLSTLGYWTPFSYLFYNLILVLILLWIIHSQQQHTDSLIEAAYCINGSAIILDIFILIFCFPHAHSVENTISLIFVILQLVIRPFSTIYLIQTHKERTGNAGLIETIFNQRNRNQSYEDIERPEPQTRSGYDISSAQQI